MCDMKDAMKLTEAPRKDPTKQTIELKWSSVTDPHSRQKSLIKTHNFKMANSNGLCLPPWGVRKGGITASISLLGHQSPEG